jgi:uncharacterized protein CbrC (UPF0167 family)
MKRCPACGKNRRLQSFGIDKSKPSGLNTYCKFCIRERSREQKFSPRDRAYKAAHQKRKRDKNRERIYEILKQSKCADCSEARWQLLEFDHVRGVKINAISWLLSNGDPIETILTEIEKCETVCVNCHRIRSYERSGSSKAPSREKK